jgi:glutamate 5-kinase
VSLLAVGVIAVEGIFQRGDVVRVIDPKGVALAHGLSNYSSQDVSKLLGVKSSDFGTRIEFVSEPELVHRDNLVVL